MSTLKSNSTEQIRNEFQKLFEMSPEEQGEYRAQMLSYIFLSEAQNAMDRKGWTRKQLAEEVGTSASYLTQLFRGDRLLNLKMVAKIEAALGIRYEVSVATNPGDNSENYLSYTGAEELMIGNLQMNER